MNTYALCFKDKDMKLVVLDATEFQIGEGFLHFYKDDDLIGSYNCDEVLYVTKQNEGATEQIK